MAGKVKPRVRPRTNLETRIRLGAVCRGLDHDYVSVRQPHPTMPLAPQVTKMEVLPMAGGVGSAPRSKIVKMGKVKCSKCGRVTWLPVKE